MKNWLPLVLGPALAMASTPGPTIASPNASSGNLRPQSRARETHARHVINQMMDSGVLSQMPTSRYSLISPTMLATSSATCQTVVH